MYNYLKSKNYNLSVGRIGKLECDFIARRGLDEYFYIQVTKNIDGIKNVNIIDFIYNKEDLK